MKKVIEFLTNIDTMIDTIGYRIWSNWNSPCDTDPDWHWYLD